MSRTRPGWRITDPEKPPPVPSIPSSCDERFAMTAPHVMSHLITDFGFTEFQAAGIVGNLGHHFGDFRLMQDAHPSSGDGGLGWAQWRAPRLRNFEVFCRDKGLDPTSDEANYSFLKQELQTSESHVVPALRATTALTDAVRVFDALYYIRAGGKDSMRSAPLRRAGIKRVGNGDPLSRSGFAEPQTLNTGEYLVWYSKSASR